jgi:hypothetical protein
MIFVKYEVVDDFNRLKNKITYFFQIFYFSIYNYYPLRNIVLFHQERNIIIYFQDRLMKHFYCILYLNTYYSFHSYWII